MEFPACLVHFLTLHILFSWFNHSTGQLEPIEKARFKEFDISPGITLLPPENILKVSYHYKNVKLGNYLQGFEVMDAPVFVQWPRDVGAYYMLFLLGPDVPSSKNPISKHCQHWVISNIPGNRIDDGEVSVEYVGLTHHYLPGSHRIVFLVYKQPYNFTMAFELSKLTKRQTGKERLNFSLQNFVDKYYLGRPVASNFFRVLISKAPPKPQPKRNNTVDPKRNLADLITNLMNKTRLF